MSAVNPGSQPTTSKKRHAIHISRPHQLKDKTARHCCARRSKHGADSRGFSESRITELQKRRRQVSESFPRAAPARSIPKSSGQLLFCEWIGTYLEMHELTWGALPSLDMPCCAFVIVSPNAPALPTRIGIVDAAIHIARVKSHRVWHPHHRPGFCGRLKYQQGV